MTIVSSDDYSMLPTFKSILSYGQGKIQLVIWARQNLDDEITGTHIFYQNPDDKFTGTHILVYRNTY